MPVSPPRERSHQQRLRSAWATYALSTEGLEGREYEAAEEQAWAALQRELDELRAPAAGPADFGI